MKKVISVQLAVLFFISGAAQAGIFGAHVRSGSYPVAAAQKEFSGELSLAADSKGDQEIKPKGKVCPVMGVSVGPGSGFALEHNGKEYHFCCAGCAAKFRENPDAYIQDHGGK